MLKFFNQKYFSPSGESPRQPREGIAKITDANCFSRKVTIKREKSSFSEKKCEQRP